MTAAHRRPVATPPLPPAQEPVARPTGTTVAVTDLFAPLPVRRREFEKGIKRQYARLLLALQAYAVASLGVRFTVTNTAGSKTSTVLSTQVRVEPHVGRVELGASD